MRKTILTAIIIAMTTVTFAQINFGLRAGANLADYSNIENSDKKVDFYFGALLSIKTGSLYTLQPEFTYSRQGTKLVGNYELFASNKISVNYFSLAVANKFNVANKVHFLIGPYFDIVMDKNINYATQDNNGYNYYDNIPPVDLGVVFGFGFDATKNLTVEARYKQGFIGVVDRINNSENNGSYYGDDRHTNKVIQLGITYKFDLLKSK